MKHLTHGSRSRAGRLRDLAGALALLLPSAALLAAPARAQLFGDWTGTVELYASASGLPTGTGTLANPAPSIGTALAIAAANGDLGVNPVTINLVGSAPFGPGETFPIALPAHGVSIEAHYVGAGPLPVVTTGMTGAPEVFLIDTVGNAALPPTVIRGLDVRNTGLVAGSADIRIAIANAPAAPTRIAPEIRDCVLQGSFKLGPDFGLQVLGQANVIDEAVFERNLVTRNDLFGGVAAVDVAGTAAGVESPLLRCNRLQRFETNLRVLGGALANQTRVQSNFIQVGETNVDLDDCAPYLVNNTIAFAASFTGSAQGLRWGNNMAALGLSNNLMWNPDLSGPTPDVVGPLGVFSFAAPLERWAFFNVDEDDRLFNETQLGTPGVLTTIALTGLTPGFAGGDFPAAGAVTDLHLLATSPLIDGGATDGFVTDLVNGVSSATIPFAPGAVDVRRDTVYDVDFEGRLQGFSVDVGADDFTGQGLIAPSPTRNATLAPVTGVVAPNGTDLDLLGNLRPDGGGQWNTQVDVIGNPGDFFMLFGSFDFTVLAATPAGVVVENRFVYQNLLISSAILPGVLTLTNLGIEAGPNSLLLSSGLLPAGGVFRLNLTLGPAIPGLFEAETHLQALVADPTLTLVQSTRRLHVEMNE